jgi:hypothetical protein
MREGGRGWGESNLLSLVPRVIIYSMNMNAISQTQRHPHHAHAHVRRFVLGRV